MCVPLIKLNRLILGQSTLETCCSWTVFVDLQSSLKTGQSLFTCENTQIPKAVILQC